MNERIKSLFEGVDLDKIPDIKDIHISFFLQI